VLHGSPHSQYSYKVALMLRLSGARFSFRYVSFQRGMHKSAEFRALSRWGQIPVLQHGERVLVQSGAILEYLAEALGTFAGTPSTRQCIREWLYWNADRLAPAIYGCYAVKLGQMNKLSIAIAPAVAQEHRRRAEAALATLDANLETQAFLAGDEPTIADICCYGESAFAQLSDLDIAPLENVACWAQRIAELPGFAAPFDLLQAADSEPA